MHKKSCPMSFKITEATKNVPIVTISVHDARKM